MSAFSDDLENKLNDHALGTTTYAPGTTLTIKLYTAAPTDAGGGTEVSGGSYASVALTNSPTFFPNCPGSGEPTKTNGTLIQFPTASASWGTVGFWGLWNGAALMAHGALAQARAVVSGDSPKIEIGALSIQLLNSGSTGFTVATRRKMLDLAFGQVSYPKPTTVYASAATAISGETLTHWTDASYARAAATFGASSGGVAANTNSVEVSASVATGGATISHYGIWDDPTSGTLIGVGPLTTPRSPAVTDSVRFAIGALTMTVQ